MVERAKSKDSSKSTRSKSGLKRLLAKSSQSTLQENLSHGSSKLKVVSADEFTAEISSLRQWLDLAVVQKLDNVEKQLGFFYMELGIAERSRATKTQLANEPFCNPPYQPITCDDDAAIRQPASDSSCNPLYQPRVCVDTAQRQPASESSCDSSYQPMPCGDMECSLPFAESNDLWSSSHFLPKAQQPQALQPLSVWERPDSNPDNQVPEQPCNLEQNVSRAAASAPSLDAEAVMQKVTSRQRRKCVANVWSFLDDPESSRAASWYLNGMVCVICASVAMTLIQSIESPPLEGKTAFMLDCFFECVFLIELIVRFGFCPDRKVFMCDVYNCLDFAAVVPLVLRIRSWNVALDYSTDVWVLALVGVVPMLRILKTLRHFKQFQLLLSALSLCLEALPICMFAMVTLTLIFSALIYLVEPRTNIISFPQVIWVVIVTMTTLGYGDVLPSTTGGYLGISLIVVSSVMFIAMPLGIIGHAFTAVWQDRDRILLVHGVRHRMRIWGYGASDIPTLFEMYDDDGTGELVVTEFNRMLEDMHIGLPDERIVQLFRSIDTDGGGSIDAKEFVQALFPQYLAQVFSGEGSESFGEWISESCMQEN